MIARLPKPKITARLDRSSRSGPITPESIFSPLLYQLSYLGVSRPALSIRKINYGQYLGGPGRGRSTTRSEFGSETQLLLGRRVPAEPTAALIELKDKCAQPVVASPNAGSNP